MVPNFSAPGTGFLEDGGGAGQELEFRLDLLAHPLWMDRGHGDRRRSSGEPLSLANRPRPVMVPVLGLGVGDRYSSMILHLLVMPVITSLSLLILFI